MARKNSNPNTVSVNISKDQIIKLLNGEIGKISKQINGIYNMIKSADIGGGFAHLSGSINELTEGFKRLELDKLVRSEAKNVLEALHSCSEGIDKSAEDIGKSIAAIEIVQTKQSKELASIENTVASLAKTGDEFNKLCTTSMSNMESSVSDINTALAAFAARAETDKQEYEKSLAELAARADTDRQEYEKDLAAIAARADTDKREYEESLAVSEAEKESMEAMHQEKIDEYEKMATETETQIKDLQQKAEELQSRLDSYEKNPYRAKYNEVVEHKNSNHFADVNTSSYEGFIACCSDGEVIKRLFNEVKNMIKQGKPEEDVLLYNDLLMFCMELYNINNANNTLKRYEQDENTEYNRSYNEKMFSTDLKIVSAILLKGIVDQNNLVFGDCKSLVEVR